MATVDQPPPFHFASDDPVAAFRRHYGIDADQALERVGLKVTDCDGLSLAAACRRQQLDPVLTLADLALQLDRGPVPDEGDWTAATLDELIQHLIDCHHSFVRVQLGRLRAMLAQLVAATQGSSMRLDRLQAALSFLGQRWEGHMEMEERDFFPVCLQLENCRDLVDREELDAMLTKVRRMSHDHRDIEQLEERVSSAFDNAIPDLVKDQPQLVAAFERALKDFHADAHLHGYKEDEILLPAVQFAQEVRRSDTESGRFNRYVE